MLVSRLNHQVLLTVREGAGEEREKKGKNRDEGLRGSPGRAAPAGEASQRPMGEGNLGLPGLFLFVAGVEWADGGARAG